MTQRDLILMAVGGGAIVYGFLNLEKYQGCLGTEQEVKMVLGDARPVACNTADIEFLSGEGSGTEISVSCDAGTENVMLFGATLSAPVCGKRFSVIDKWKGGPVETWNVALNITWEK